jgi:hypothetical protein
LNKGATISQIQNLGENQQNSTSNAIGARTQRSLNKQWKSFKNTPKSETFK